jgi:hypothetical protein
MTMNLNMNERTGMNTVFACIALSRLYIYIIIIIIVNVKHQ